MNEVLMRNMTHDELLNFVDLRDPQVAELAYRLDEQLKLVRTLRAEFDRGSEAVLDDMK